MNKLTSNIRFFNQLAEDYDQMISFNEAVEKRKKVLLKFTDDKKDLAADLGCGTGIDSVALTLLGLKVDSFDPSPEMIKVAMMNAKRKEINISFYNNPIELIPDGFNYKYGLVISLGNTFANVTKEKFYASVNKCFNLLRKKGTLLIQVLNYEKVIKEEKRIVNITKGKAEYFVRFYDFFNDEITFNILKFGNENPAKYNLISTRLYSHTKSDFEHNLKSVGFSSLEFFSDFNLTPFDADKAKDLVIKAIKA